MIFLSSWNIPFRNPFDKILLIIISVFVYMKMSLFILVIKRKICTAYSSELAVIFFSAFWRYYSLVFCFYYIRWYLCSQIVFLLCSFCPIHFLIKHWLNLCQAFSFCPLCVCVCVCAAFWVTLTSLDASFQEMQGLLFHFKNNIHSSFV